MTTQTRSQNPWNGSPIGFGASQIPITSEPKAIRRCIQVVSVAVRGGIRVIDTAPNYAHGFADLVVGFALQDLFAARKINRRDVVILTKLGYPSEIVEDEAELTYGLSRISSDELAENGHCLDPRYLKSQLAENLRRLQLEMADYCLLHNPEEQLLRYGPQRFRERILRAFTLLESLCDQGMIGAYGVAAGDGFLPGHAAYHPVQLLCEIAELAGGCANRFRMIQLPLNLANYQRVISNTNEASLAHPVIEAARTKGLFVVASAALNGMHLPLETLKAVGEASPNLRKPAQIALQFARSIPGVNCALFGTQSLEHVQAALEVLAQPPYRCTPAGQ